jgi:hypothetical protein
MMSAKAAPAAALRRLRDVLRIIRKPRFLPQPPCRHPREWIKPYSAFAENQRRQDAMVTSASRGVQLVAPITFVNGRARLLLDRLPADPSREQPGTHAGQLSVDGSRGSGLAASAPIQFRKSSSPSQRVSMDDGFSNIKRRNDDARCLFVRFAESN